MTVLDWFSNVGRRRRADRANTRGNALDNQGHTDEAIEAYGRACAIDPRWAVPHYNLGLVYKYQGQWERSLEHNLRATELAPDSQDGWWNLGIAATALGRWDVARRAWRGAGLEVPDGSGPLDLPCGHNPIRLNPEGEGEVVWSDRLDPARARICNIPLKDFCFGDIVLNDGAANGYLMLGEREVPVFDCLQLLEPSPFSTWVVEMELDDPSESEGPSVIDQLEELAHTRGLAAENWSTSVKVLCKACSEGTPHSHDEHPQAPLEGAHRIAIAARSKEEACDLLELWRPAAGDVRIGSIEIEFSRSFC